jgi:hypothetical protein
MDIEGMSDIPDHTATTQIFGPYPNQSSFLLGEWYWCEGSQKSKEGFHNLVDILIDPDFSPGDLRDTRWRFIDQQLGSSEGGEHDKMWVDEDHAIDAGWANTSVTVHVPFRNTSTSSAKGKARAKKSVEGHVEEYTIPDFYHRSIPTILREKLQNEQEFQRFHLEPFELHWQPRDGMDSIPISGELYNSPAFIEAHREVQELPREAGCSLPRCVAGLMIASDSTHLTSFGQAKLWPAYLYFGNDSKYRRGKPSLHLCNHIAYFHKVSRKQVRSL